MDIRVSKSSRMSAPFTYTTRNNTDSYVSSLPALLKRLSTLNLIKHVPRAVFKGNNMTTGSSSKSQSSPGHSWVLDGPTLDFLFSTPDHRRSHSDSLPNSERPTFKLFVQPPYQSMNESPASQLALGQAHEPGSSPNSHSYHPVSSHVSSRLSPSANTSGLDFTEDALEEVIVPELLLHGTPLLKVSAKKVQTRVFRLDPDRGQISWESKKTKYLSIDAIKEIRTGEDTCSYRVQLKITVNRESR